jgi:hypothetical protein
MIFWIALAALFIAICGGIAFVVVRGLQLWRDVKRTSSAFGAEINRINEISRQIEHHMDAAEAASGRLQVARGRLAASRERLDVQLAAVREARAQVRRTFWFVPGL